MAVSRLMRSGVRFKSVGMLTDLAGSVKGWRCFKVRQPGRRSDRRVSELVHEGMAGVWAWTSRAMWSMADRMDSLSGGSVSDAVVPRGTREGAASPEV